MNSELSLLYPEWQGYGEHQLVYEGALKIAENLFDINDFISVPVELEKNLKLKNGVLGLSPIAEGFQEVLQILRTLAPRRIFMIAGTCGAEVAPVGYLNEFYQGEIAVVWFDAHGDLNTPASSPSGHFHGMALRTLLGEGPAELIGELKNILKPEQVFLAATRDLDPPEAEFCAAKQISISPPEDFGEPQKLVDEIRKRGFKRLYLHLDLDAINPESYPNSLMQTAGGPSIEESQTMMKALSENFEIVGFSIVEYCERGAKIEVLRDFVSGSGIKIGVTRDLQ